MSNKFVKALAAFTVLIASCTNTQQKAVTGDSIISKPVPGSAIHYDSSKRYIFLTWDDSPQPPGTINCKKIFREENVKATFFSVGFNVVGPQKKRIIDSLLKDYPQFLVANHSFSHGFKDNYKKFYALPDSAYNDFIKNEKELGIGVKIIRLPGRNTWASNGKLSGQESKGPLVKKLDSAGYKIIGWDIEWAQHSKMKAPKQSAVEMAAEVNRKLEDGNTVEQNAIVILSHDRLFEKTQFADSLRKFISILKQDPRNVFETIDHYPLVQRK